MWEGLSEVLVAWSQFIKGNEFVTHTHTLLHRNMEGQVGDCQVELSKVVQSGLKKTSRQAGRLGVKETRPLFIRHPAEAIS